MRNPRPLKELLHTSNFQSSSQPSHFDFRTLSISLENLDHLRTSGTTSSDIVAWNHSVHVGQPPVDVQVLAQSEEDAFVQKSAMASSGYVLQGLPAMSPSFAYGPYADQDYTHEYIETHGTGYQHDYSNPGGSSYYVDGFADPAYGHQSVVYPAVSMGSISSAATNLCPSDPAVELPLESESVELANYTSHTGARIYDFAGCDQERAQFSALRYDQSTDSQGHRSQFRASTKDRATPMTCSVGKRANDDVYINGVHYDESKHDLYPPDDKVCDDGKDHSKHYSCGSGSPPESQHSSGSSSTDDSELAPVRKDPLYDCRPDKDGYYRCPYKPKENCEHKPTRQKCTYDKYIDSHLKPHRCKQPGCEDLRFSSTACRLRHEREAHGSHGHGVKPYLCVYPDCERSKPGNGFPRSWNCNDHMKRMHDHETSSEDSDERPKSPPYQPFTQSANEQSSRKRSAQEGNRGNSDKRQRSSGPATHQSKHSSSSKVHDEAHILKFKWNQHYQRMHYNIHHMRGPGDIEVLQQLNKDIAAMQAISQRLAPMS